MGVKEQIIVEIHKAETSSYDNVIVRPVLQIWILLKRKRVMRLDIFVYVINDVLWANT